MKHHIDQAHSFACMSLTCHLQYAGMSEYRCIEQVLLYFANGVKEVCKHTAGALTNQDGATL